MTQAPTPTNDSQQFKASSIHASRLVWHPGVHAWYNEHCYYFLLRLRDPDLEIVHALTGLLAKSQISSFCTYALYGYYDILLRTWATVQKRARFVRLLEEQRLIERVHEFQAISINYLWMNGAPSAQDVQGQCPRFRGDIESVASELVGHNGKQSPVLDRLISEKLLHLKPHREQTSIKFYVALSRVPGAMEHPYETEEITTFFSSTDIGLRDISVYCGIGFANYLVKAFVESYSDVLTAMKAIVAKGRRLNLRPMTLLIANNDAPESDYIDVNWHEFPTQLLQLEMTLGMRYAPMIAKLTEEERQAVGNLYHQHSHLLGTPFEPIFRALFTARLDQDELQLQEKLSFMVRLEGLLRKFFINAWQQKISGGDWFQIVTQEGAAGVNLSPDKNPVREYTLGDFVTVTDKLIALGHLRREDIEHTLQSNWRKRLDAIREPRNAFAHGKFDEKQYVGKDWPSLVEAICGVAPIYNTLVQMYAGNDSNGKLS